MSKERFSLFFCFKKSDQISFNIFHVKSKSKNPSYYVPSQMVEIFPFLDVSGL
jgi:hypothetical protein